MDQIQQVTNFDGDYTGAMAGTLDIDEPAKQIIGEPNPSDVFAYMFRRFGYPRFGWDDYKTLVQYYITTGMDGVVLMIQPAFAGGGTFGYVLRKDIDQACQDEKYAPMDEWTKHFEEWTKNEHNVETVHFLEQDGAKLKRVWDAWCSDHINEDDAHSRFFADQERIRLDMMNEYKPEHPLPEQVKLCDLPSNTMTSQCHNALCATIEDLLQPVHVRDAAINICGKVRGDVECVDYSSMAGIGVGNKLDEAKR